MREETDGYDLACVVTIDPGAGISICKTVIAAIPRDIASSNTYEMQSIFVGYANTSKLGRTFSNNRWRGT